MTLRHVRTAHLYLGLTLAPLLIFFSLTGAWQAIELHRSLKDGSYIAPRPLTQLSQIHIKQEWIREGTQPRPSWAFKWLAAAAGLAITALAALGLVMALKTARRKWLSLTLLAAGTALPILLIALGSGA